MKDVIRKIIKYTHFNYKDYAKTNILFLTFMITNLINGLLIRYVTVKNYFDIKPIIADIAILVLFGAIAYIIKPRARIIYFISLSIIFTIICIVNSIYYTFYTSFASVSLLATSAQVSDVSDAVVKNVLQLSDFIFIWQPFVMFFVHRSLNKRDYYVRLEKIENRKKRFINTVIFGIFITVIFILSLSAYEISRFNKQWNREYLVAKFGIFTYQVNDIVKSLQPKINTLFGYDKSVKIFNDYYQKRNNQKSTNKYTDIFKGRNVIVIHAESMQTIAMNMKFNGEEVTPNLNKIASEGMFFSNFYSQVSVGTSSDTEFTFNTSLMPAASGTVFVSYSDRNFISIPKLLKENNYYAFSMHGNNGTFWNRLVMHKKLGYDDIIHKSDFVIDEEIGLGLSDKSFFRQSIPKIKAIKETQKRPIYVTSIMLSNHTPFDAIDKYGDFAVDYKYEENGEIISAPYMEGTLLGNYFKSVRYADSAIGEFISGLDLAGLLENTVIVIYGDHDARLPRKEYNRLFNYDYYTDEIKDKEDPTYVNIDSYQYELNKKVPFIIWTKDKKFNLEINKLMGMYDVMPTLGNMLGIYNPYALGHDIFSINDNIVIFPNGNFLTDKVYYNNQKEEYLMLDNNPLDNNYIKERVALTEELLEVSNSIIVHDLFNKLVYNNGG